MWLKSINSLCMLMAIVSLMCAYNAHGSEHQNGSMVCINEKPPEEVIKMNCHMSRMQAQLEDIKQLQLEDQREQNAKIEQILQVFNQKLDEFAEILRTQFNQAQREQNAIIDEKLQVLAQRTERIEKMLTDAHPFLVPRDNIRLVPEGHPVFPFSGRLEIKHNGMWGTVCDDLFDNTDALVACRELGFSRGTFTGNAKGGSGRIWLSTVQCTGRESRLVDCPRRNNRAIGSHDCGHYEDVFITCVP